MPKLVKDIPEKKSGGEKPWLSENLAARKLADENPGKWVEVDLDGRKPGNASLGFRTYGYETAIRRTQLFIRRPLNV